VQIHVSVGILIDSHNKILLAQRPNSRSWAGWWEFPGGKIEGNETPHDALKRELKEEIGIEVINCESWTIRNYSYTEHQVTLYFFKITKWTGDPVSNENQRLVWLYPYQVDRKTILPPNIFILNALTMPSYYAITNISETPKRIFYSQLENQLKQGLKMVQIREKYLSFLELKKVSEEIMAICKPFSAKVIINSNINLVEDLNASGVHLTSLQLKVLDKKPSNMFVGASCHSEVDIMIAEEKGIDFVVLSPVNKTLSHLDIKPMGWKNFSKIANKTNIPIYALGGMKRVDLSRAYQYGAIGISSQRDAWSS